MTESTLVALVLAIFAWSIFAHRLTAFNLSGPLVLTTAGLLLGNSRFGIITVDVESSTVHLLAELTLALLLFADASSVPVTAARHDLPLTARLLGVGLPLSFVAGTAIAVVLFPNLPLGLAALIAASLAPTDAALSAPVIADKRLPIGIRRVLNVESGLNDGIATPVVTFCIAASATAIGLAAHDHEDGIGGLVELMIGIAVGVGIGLVGGWLVRLAHQRAWTEHGSRRLATLSLALAAFLVASETGGNPFVAAFIGGLAFGASAQNDTAESMEFTELTGSLLSLVVWFVFGAGFVMPAFEELDWRSGLYAAASLTVVRMIPVALSLIGSGQHRASVAFVGWFGPRGLASVVFALLALEELGGTDPRVATALNTIAITVTFSVLAHGLTARPLTTWYVGSLPPEETGPAGA